MAGPNTIALKFENFFDPEIKDRIKTMPDAKYDFDSKEWLLRKDLKQDLLQKIADLCIERCVQLVDVPDFVFDIVQNSVPFSSVKKGVKNVPKHDYSREIKIQPKLEDLPESLKCNLYDFQKKGVQFGIERFGRLLLGDEMGVGKTIQAIAIAYLYKADWPLLVIAPSSLVNI